MSVWPSLSTWEARGQHLHIHGDRIFSLDSGAGTGLPLIILHGFPTSSHDFAAALPHLNIHRRVLLHDHLGFGLSDKPRDSGYSLFEQAELALGVWQAAGITEAHLLAHDYGTSVATELLALDARGRLPIRLHSLTLMNGSVHLALARLTPGQRLGRMPSLEALTSRLTNAMTFKLQMRRIFSSPETVDEEVLEMMWQGVQRADGHRLLTRLQRYLAERTRFARRWHGALETFTPPAHVLWGDRDPVAGPEIARWLHQMLPQAQLSWMEGVGHYPMVEAPTAWATKVNDFLREVEEGAEPPLGPPA